MMDEEARQRVLMSALTTEHLVLQTAASSLNIEASARSSLYMLMPTNKSLAFAGSARKNSLNKKLDTLTKPSSAVDRKPERSIQIKA